MFDRHVKTGKRFGNESGNVSGLHSFLDFDLAPKMMSAALPAIA